MLKVVSLKQQNSRKGNIDILVIKVEKATQYLKTTIVLKTEISDKHL